MRTIIWDFDGTLGYRDGGAWTATLWEVLQKLEPERHITQEQLRPYMQAGFPWHEPDKPHSHLNSADVWWRAMQPVLANAYTGVGFESQRAYQLAAHFRSTYLQLHRWHLYADVKPVLDILRADGWTHVILSNHVPELPEITQHLGLTPHIHRVFNSAEIGYEKPNPKAFRVVTEALPNLQDVWMVGDNIQADVAGAMNLGIPAVLVRKFHPDAKFYAETLYDVPSIFKTKETG